ncbi:MAG: M20/M25/M40 family metallo-hydrolase [Pyrinomonadaceae bacterium]
MKKQLFSLLLLTSFAFSVSAQKADLTAQNLRKTVEYLASDKLEGRRTGEQGATSAAGYVANMFAQYKLKAGVSKTANGKTSKNYLQAFPYVTGVEMAKDNAFSLEITNGNGQRVKIENMLPIQPVGFSPNGEVAGADVVFAGFGISSSEAKYDDYNYDGENLDVKGKIVLAFDGTPDSSPRSPFARFDARAKANIAKEKGAVGLLLISREAKFEDEKLAKLKYDQTLGEAALPTFVISKNTAQNILGVKEGELEMIEGLVAMRKDAGVKTKVGYRDTRPRASFKVNLVKKQTQSYNVVGILPGTDANLKNEAIVIGGHYDHLGKGGAGSLDVNSQEIHHGADDNASGVAAVLELARQFSKSKANKRTLVFIAFGGEEEGLIGSKFYVNNPAFPIEKTVAMINLDMVGRLKDEKLTVGGIGTASEWKDLVNSKNDNSQLQYVKYEGQKNAFKTVGTISEEEAKKLVNAKAAVPVTETNTGKLVAIGIKSLLFQLQLNEDGFGPSDHSSFYGKQIPVLFFFTGTHADYHKPSDTADKINYEGLQRVTDFVGEIVKSIDLNPIKPTYTVAKSSGMGGRTTFNVSLGTVPSYSEGKNDGLLLDGVRDASPAAKSGLKAGDKIIKLAGHDIRNISDYVFVLGEMKADVEYEVMVVRGAETLTLKIVPAARK